MPAGPDDALHPGGAPTPLAPTHLTLLPWPDTVIDRVGHDPRSEYVERFWLGVIGPSCCWFLRHLAVRFEAEPDGFDLDVAECARALGLGAGLGRNAPLGRTVTRCCQFGLTRRFGRDGLAVRRRLPPLARHHVARLPDALQQEHGRWTGALGAVEAVGTGGRVAPVAGPVDPGGAGAAVLPHRAGTSRPAPFPGDAPPRPPGPRPGPVDTERLALAAEAGRMALRLLRDGHDPEAARRSLEASGAPAALARAAVDWAVRRLGSAPVPAA